MMQKGVIIKQSEAFVQIIKFQIGTFNFHEIVNKHRLKRRAVTAWKVSKSRAFSGSYFLGFGLNMEIYFVVLAVLQLFLMRLILSSTNLVESTDNGYVIQFFLSLFFSFFYCGIQKITYYFYSFLLSCFLIYNRG